MNLTTKPHTKTPREISQAASLRGTSEELMDEDGVSYVGLCAPTGFITNHIDVPTYAAVDRSLQALQQFAERVFGPVDQLSRRHPRSK